MYYRYSIPRNEAIKKAEAFYCLGELEGDLVKVCYFGDFSADFLAKSVVFVCLIEAAIGENGDFEVCVVCHKGNGCDTATGESTHNKEFCDALGAQDEFEPCAVKSAEAMFDDDGFAFLWGDFCGHVGTPCAAHEGTAFFEFWGEDGGVCCWRWVLCVVIAEGGGGVEYQMALVAEVVLNAVDALQGAMGFYKVGAAMAMFSFWVDKVVNDIGAEEGVHVFFHSFIMSFCDVFVKICAFNTFF